MFQSRIPLTIKRKVKIISQLPKPKPPKPPRVPTNTRDFYSMQFNHIQNASTK